MSHQTNTQFIISRCIGYGTLRLSLGVNMLMHGLMRLAPDTHAAFVDGVAARFADTVLPGWLLIGFAYSIPLIEFSIGILLIPGLLTRTGLTIGSLLMAAFIFGQCLIQNWQTAHFVMIYALTYFVLFYFIDYNAFSLDGLIRIKLNKRPSYIQVLDKGPATPR